MMHAGMIPAGLANTHPTERAVRRDKLVFSSTQVQKKERKPFAPILYCQGETNCCSNFLHCTNSRLASGTPHGEIILSPLSRRLLADPMSAAATHLPNLTTNLDVGLVITMLPWRGTSLLFRFACDKAPAACWRGTDPGGLGSCLP